MLTVIENPDMQIIKELATKFVKSVNVYIDSMSSWILQIGRINF